VTVGDGEFDEIITYNQISTIVQEEHIQELDNPVTLANNADQNGLLDLTGWKRLKNITVSKKENNDLHIKYGNKHWLVANTEDINSFNQYNTQTLFDEIKITCKEQLIR